VIWIIEIENQNGNTARKKYHAFSMYEAIEDAEFELIDYPDWWLSRIWIKGEEPTLGWAAVEPQ
jgi:hypothetical protein